MVKQSIKIYLNLEDIKRLESKARESGFIGKGSVSHYIERIAREPVVFLDANLKVMLKALDLK